MNTETFELDVKHIAFWTDQLCGRKGEEGAKYLCRKFGLVSIKKWRIIVSQCE